MCELLDTKNHQDPGLSSYFNLYTILKGGLGGRAGRGSKSQLKALAGKVYRPCFGWGGF